MPTSFGKRLKFSDKKLTVIDGPFTETKEVVAGFALWEVRSIEEALEWARKVSRHDGLRGRTAAAVLARNVRSGLTAVQCMRACIERSSEATVSRTNTNQALHRLTTLVVRTRRFIASDS
jgi:hypothetical protein